jgi:hypothetical protein
MLEQVFIEFKKKIDAEAIRRQEKGGLALVQWLRVAIKNVTKVSSGSQGSLLSLTSNTKAESNSIRTQVGFSNAADYLKYRLFGVLPATGALYPAHTKMPPVALILKWVHKSGLSIPDWAKDHAEFNAEEYAKEKVPEKFQENKAHPWYSIDAATVWAFSIAKRLKEKGRLPLQINGRKGGGALLPTLFNQKKSQLLQIIHGTA